MKYFLAIFLAVALTACSPATLTATFKPAEANFINASGKGTVEGQAFLRRNDGIVVYAAGSEVNLIPVTAYSSERIATIYGTGKTSYFGRNFSNDDPAYYQYMKVVVADGEGKFSFSNVPDGSYFITTSVIWMAGNARQGGALMERVTVSGGSTQQAILRGY